MQQFQLTVREKVIVWQDVDYTIAANTLEEAVEQLKTREGRLDNEADCIERDDNSEEDYPRELNGSLPTIEIFETGDDSSILYHN